MHSRKSSSAFSLLEVIIAIALFAASITVILALLPGVGRLSSDASESLVAQRLPDALQVELRRLAASGIDALAAQVPVMQRELPEGFTLVAARTGARLHSRDVVAPVVGAIPPDEQYYLIECWRLADEPLRYDSQKGFLALVVRVTWPYRVSGNTDAVASDMRSQLLFTTVLTP